MANLNSVSYNQIVTPADISVMAHGSDTKSMARTFYDEMAEVMRGFADREGSMTVLGVTLEGEDKYGAVGTTLLNQFMTDNGNAIETVMSLQQFMIKLEQDISKVG